MDTPGAPAAAMKPALASISVACQYLGSVSRAKLYADLLPQLETVHIGSRHFVVVESMDRLIEKLKGSAVPKDHLMLKRGQPLAEAESQQNLGFAT
jgi:hypothetical protein